MDDPATRQDIRRIMEALPEAVMFASNQTSTLDLLIHNPIHALVADPPMLARLASLAPATGPARIVAVVNGRRSPAEALPPSVALVSLSDPDAPLRLHRAILWEAGTPAATGVLGGCPGFATMVGASPIMQETFERIQRIAAGEETVLIHGETGTGKELAARAIHAASARHQGSFAVMHRGNGPSSLLESYLFGHRRGAFTGASRDRRGCLESAQHGTLLIDDLDTLDLTMQAKLLRLLQDKCFTPLGSNRVIRADVRYLATSNKDLGELVRRGELRQDLYYRIKVLTLEMPPLRRRAGDIPWLVRHFMSRSTRNGRRTITPSGYDLLARYPWPGNVRELESVIHRICAFSDAARIEAADIQPHLESARWDPPPTDWAQAAAEFKSQLVDEAMAQSGGNITQAAARLGIHRNTLRAYLKRRTTGRTKPHFSPDSGN